MSNHPPDVIVGFTREEADFIIANCDQNVGFALSALSMVSRDGAIELVTLIEQFKRIKAAVNKGLEE